MFSNLKNATSYVFALLAITIVGIIVLIAINKVVPKELWGFLALLGGGTLGIATPSSGSPPPPGSPLP